MEVHCHYQKLNPHLNFYAEYKVCLANVAQFTPSGYSYFGWDIFRGTLRLTQRKTPRAMAVDAQWEPVEVVYIYQSILALFGKFTCQGRFPAKNAQQMRP